MLGTVASVLIYGQKRRLFDVFPPDIRKLWKDDEVRVLILLSLVLQIALIFLGKMRKYEGRTRLRITIWSAYLLADWCATFALGVISQNTLEECKKGRDEKSKDELMAFWALFLLLHLGGPDTITAYSLEDNELWLRHLAGFVIHSWMAIYVLLLALPGPSWFLSSSVLILIAGLVKYGERIMALRSASLEYLRGSMLSEPDPGPNYAKFMEEFTLKKAKGYMVRASEVKELPIRTSPSNPAGLGKEISEAYDHFETFKRLFVDLILSFQDRDSSRSYFRALKPEEAFHVIEVELGFAFDLFFTKAPIIYNAAGWILRVFTLSFTIVSFIIFSRLCEVHKYQTIDLVISYLLMSVAIILEVYASVVILRSDWMARWLGKHDKTPTSEIINSCLDRPKEPRWSNSMAQCNVLGFCLEQEKLLCCKKILHFFHIDEFLENRQHMRYEKISGELKALIFTRFMEFTGSDEGVDPTELCTESGRFEFDRSVLILHLATDLCYYADWGDNAKEASTKSKESKHISDYMLYLLIMCPFMLPMGIGTIRFRDTCAEAKQFFEEKNLKNDKVVACAKLLQVNTEVSPSKVKGDRSKSVLFDACRLARKLQRTETKDEKWEKISCEWVKMLAYAAKHCRGNHHAQQLRKGGEFLSHVWFLMAHLGITGQFQIDQGHARAKLITK